ncbi:MAG TPA: hypothetical protein PLM72_01800 [Spirochaetota bacterium]|nr:hypothetical protein [Spirochaetota bacterium]HQO21793.1 hypothetical protein [Spirochaetota bacterium]
MIKTKHLISSLFLLSASALLSVKLFPNGGPVDGSSLNSSGNIFLKNVKNVELISEKLFFKPLKSRIDVKVSYELNNSGDIQTIDYGFPFYNISYNERDNGSEVSSVYQEFSNQDSDIINDFEILLNCKKTSSMVYVDKLGKSEIKWYLSKLELKKGINKVDVSYSAKAKFCDWSTSKCPGVSYSKRTFSYNLKPAGSWGNGILPKFELTVDAGYIENRKGDIQISFSGKTEKKGTIYKSTATNFDLKQAKPIHLTYDISKYFNALEDQSLSPIKNISEINASSSLQGNYKPENLIDAGYSTAWAEGVSGQGINESINIKFKDSSNIKIISILNGYQKTAETYFNNSRIKKVKLEMLISSNGVSKTEIREIELKDHIRDDFTPVFQYEYDQNIRNPRQSLITAEDFDYEYSIKSVKITILEVYPGTKYEDTCISEIIAF